MKKILLLAVFAALAFGLNAQTQSTGIISTSVAATNGQVPTWNNTTKVWEPGSVASGANTSFGISGANLQITDATGTLTTTLLSIAPVQSVVAGTGALTVSSAAGVFTVNNTDPDQLLTNEGSITVGAGGASTSLLVSNTSGSTDVTLTASTGLTIAEAGNVITLTNSSPDQTVVLTGAGINAVTGTYPSFTITGTEVDGLLTNEGSLTVAAGAATTSIINSNTSGQTGVTLTAGAGLDIAEAGNVITHKLSQTGLNIFTGATGDQANSNCTDAVGTPFIWNTGNTYFILFKK